MRSSLLVAGGRRTWRAIKRGPPLGSPAKARSVSNHDAIMMCRAIVRGLSARVASKRGAAADRRACAVRGRGVTVWAAFRQPFCHIVYEAIMRQSGCNHDWGRDDQLRRRTTIGWSGVFSRKWWGFFPYAFLCILVHPYAFLCILLYF